MKGFLFFFPLSLSSSANATPEFEGRGGEELGTEIANTLYRVFSSEGSVDLKSLCINPREHCWVLYVDVLVSKKTKTIKNLRKFSRHGVTAHSHVYFHIKNASPNVTSYFTAWMAVSL